MPETSGKAMDMESLGKIYIRTRGRYSRLDIRAIKEMRQRERIMPGKGISGRERQVCRAGCDCWFYESAVQYEPL